MTDKFCPHCGNHLEMSEIADEMDALSHFVNLAVGRQRTDEQILNAVQRYTDLHREINQKWNEIEDAELPQARLEGM